MRAKGRYSQALIGAALLALALTGCIGDPSKTIVGPYRLLQFETGQAYYLCKGGLCGGESTGILDGEVLQLGWNADYIVVEMGGPPRPHGWRIIDVRSHVVQGPMNDVDLDTALEAKHLSSVVIQSPQVAWKRLSY